MSAIDYSYVHAGSVYPDYGRWQTAGRISPSRYRSLLSPDVTYVDIVRVGETVYPLLWPMVENAGPAWYSLSGFLPHVVGRGATREKAKHEFNYLIHMHFQTISRIRPLFRTDEQQNLWQLLESTIDMEAYSCQRFVVVPHEFGRIIEDVDVGVRAVQWDNGAIDHISLANAPAEFAAYEKDSWFKAVVQRDYVTGEFQKMLHLCYTRQAPIYNLRQRTAFWNQKDVPKGTD